MSKLVRDKIPDILRKKGLNPSTHIATEEEFKIKLNEKLKEEVSEYLESENKEELADILEVLFAIFRLKGYTNEEIEQIRSKKMKERGNFIKRIIID